MLSFQKIFKFNIFEFNQEPNTPKFYPKYYEKKKNKKKKFKYTQIALPHKRA